MAVGEAVIQIHCNGVLFLDELPEFRRNVLEVMRQPLEDGSITVSRAMGSINYPASFMLVAAMNPCVCGFLTDPQKECTCTPLQIQRYRSKVSGPLLDRIDIQVEVPGLRYQELASKDAGESSEIIRRRVNRARAIQLQRFEKTKIHGPPDGQTSIQVDQNRQVQPERVGIKVTSITQI